MNRYWNAVLCAAMLTLGACATDSPMEGRAERVTTGSAGAHAHPSPAPAHRDLAADVGRVRGATARFHRLAAALEAGWTEQYPEGCAASPDGGQGYHYLNPALVDGSVTPLEPELLMYEPAADGSMKLVGVDYVIPFDAWTEEEPPTLLGQPLMRNEPLGVWAIHIWAWRTNPSGVFAPWNPDVSCEHAG